ncbi:hypothetical protein, partial [Streptomyces sp. NPDC057579]|uniref:hypothetical protein n=1 Tax=Streptomyces sp. NPDC057579 TaxID=3346172 RepID=UPI0036BDDC27
MNSTLNRTPFNLRGHRAADQKLPTTPLDSSPARPAVFRYAESKFRYPEGAPGPMGFTDTRFNVNLSILFTELPLL